jgi:hypothetical protein
MLPELDAKPHNQDHNSPGLYDYDSHVIAHLTDFTQKYSAMRVGVSAGMRSAARTKRSRTCARAWCRSSAFCSLSEDGKAGFSGAGSLCPADLELDRNQTTDLDDLVTRKIEVIGHVGGIPLHYGEKLLLPAW